MKKVLFPILAVVLALGLALPVAAHTEDDPDVIDLIAGGGNPKSAVDVGDVLVWNDGDYLYVKYVVDAPGWCLTETHLHVATSLGDIPQKKGNPPPGQFDYKTEHACVMDYTYVIELDEEWVPCDTDLCIAAHAVVVKVITEAPYYAASVDDYLQGTLNTGATIPASWNRSNPAAVLALNDPLWFFSLGFGEPDNGWIIVEFDCPIRNGDGNDVQILEVTNKTPYPSETANVSASQDGSTWFLLGIADNSDQASPTASDFDLGPLPWAKYIKVEDTSDRIYDYQGKPTDAFDLEVVVSLQDCIQEETAWGAGSDFPGKNWAMYFSYHIQEPCVSGEVINGGFETPVVTADPKWDIFDSGTEGLGWTVEWYDPEEEWISDAPSPAHLELHRGVLGAGHEGDQYAELDTDWGGPGDPQSGEPASVKIYQDIATCPGKTYTLTYAWRLRPDYDYNELEVYWDGTMVGSHSGSGGSNTSWTVETVTGLSPSTGDTTRLMFVETGTADSFGMFLDAVSLAEE